MIRFLYSFQQYIGACFAALCGVTPVPASSGKTIRHRLNRGGDRAANSALHIIAIGSLRADDKTRAYVARRVVEGHSKLEVIRIIKRYIAREVYGIIIRRHGTSTPHVLLLDKQKGVRGSQYCSHDFQQKLTEYKMIPSMSDKGNCFDNAVVETFFKSLKAELLWRQTCPTRRQATTAIFQYINGSYNTRRRHSYLGSISALAFEAKAA